MEINMKSSDFNIEVPVFTDRKAVITEYGAVNLYGKSLQERAKLIISVAHPDHREELDRAAFERFGPHFHFIG